MEWVRGRRKCQQPRTEGSRHPAAAPDAVSTAGPAAPHQQSAPQQSPPSQQPSQRQQRQRTCPARAARRAAHAVDVLLRVVRRVVLNDPVHVRDVQPARRDVRAQQHARLGLAEVEEGGRALRLLLLAVDVPARQVDVVEELRVVLDGVAGGEEHHDLHAADGQTDREGSGGGRGGQGCAEGGERARAGAGGRRDAGGATVRQPTHFDTAAHSPRAGQHTARGHSTARAAPSC